MSFSLGHMGPSNVNFKLLSSNAQRIHTFKKQKVKFNWLSKPGTDTWKLETYSNCDVENIWKKQWRGNFFFSWNLP